MLNFMANIHNENNIFVYLHAGVEKRIVIPQNSYTLTQLVQKISDLLSVQSSITATYAVVDNKI
jgi:hypothetical protein